MDINLTLLNRLVSARGMVLKNLDCFSDQCSSHSLRQFRQTVLDDKIERCSLRSSKLVFMKEPNPALNVFTTLSPTCIVKSLVFVIHY